MIYAAYSAYEKKVETTERRTDLSAQLTTLEGRAEKLEHDIKLLQDPRGIETELRSRYEVGLSGEEVIVFVEEEATTTHTDIKKEKERGFWENLVSKLF